MFLHVLKLVSGHPDLASNAPAWLVLLMTADQVSAQDTVLLSILGLTLLAA